MRSLTFHSSLKANNFGYNHHRHIRLSFLTSFLSVTFQPRLVQAEDRSLLTRLLKSTLYHLLKQCQIYASKVCKHQHETRHSSNFWHASDFLAFLLNIVSVAGVKRSRIVVALQVPKKKDDAVLRYHRPWAVEISLRTNRRQTSSLKSWYILRLLLRWYKSSYQVLLAAREEE